jgi:hypothetical protein
LNNTNRIQEQKSTNEPVTKSSTSGDEYQPIQDEISIEKHLDEQAIDLNELFPDAETDLNHLFPEEEVKSLLKNIIKNKKDMGLIKERLATENAISKESNKVEIVQGFPESDKTVDGQTD